MIKSDALIETTCTDTANRSENTKRLEPNFFAIIFIFILFISLSSWTVLTSFALFDNEEPQYPKAVLGVPFLLLLTLPPIISLLVILFRTFYTLFLFSGDTHSFEPLDLVRNEKQRQLFLLPLSVSGMVMTILPAYYLHYKKYYLVLGAQGIIGILLILLFLGISLTPESSTKSIFIPTCEK